MRRQLPVALRLDNPVRCGTYFFSDQPNSFELSISEPVAKLIRECLGRRIEVRRQIEAAASQFAGLASELGVAAVDADLSASVLVVRVSTLNPSPDGAEASLCTPDGQTIVSAPLGLLPTNRDLTSFGIPSRESNDDPGFSLIARDLVYLRFLAGSGVMKPPVVSPETRTSLIKDEPLNLTTGLSLRQWARDAGCELFVRLPDSYFEERFRSAGIAGKTRGWFFQTIRNDPYISIAKQDGAIFVLPNGAPNVCNVDRLRLETNLVAWQTTASQAELIARASEYEGPWRLSPEAVLAPVLTDHWNDWFDRNAEALRVQAHFDARSRAAKPLSADEVESLYRICRWRVGQVTRFADAVTESFSTASPYLPLSRVFGIFDTQDRALVTSHPVSVIDLPTIDLSGIGFTRDIPGFAALRAAIGSSWGNLPEDRRKGKYQSVNRCVVLIGRPWSSGLRFSVDTTEGTQNFDVLTLEGLPQEARAAVEAATPPGTHLGPKP